jgi:hypothetical protein
MPNNSTIAQAESAARTLISLAKTIQDAVAQTELIRQKKDNGSFDLNNIDFGTSDEFGYLNAGNFDDFLNVVSNFSNGDAKQARVLAGGS